LCLLLAALTAPPVQALITQHGSEKVACSGWSAPLTDIVNDPARVSGEVGPLGPSARFHYRGDLAAFQRVLGKFAALTQQPLIVYVEAGIDSEDDFALSITHEGQGFLHLSAAGSIPFGQIKIPAGVTVETLPEPVEPIDPQARNRLFETRKRIAEFIAAQTSRLNAITLAPGAPAPPINAIAADGNAFLTEHVKGKAVLLVFWSVHQPASIRQFGVLENLRREFAGKPIQIISLCIEEDWETWQRMMREQGPIDFGDGPKPFDSDPQWWQLIQAAGAPATAAAYGVTKAPAAFLIGKDGRFAGLRISGERLRDTVEAALRSNPAR
jgi:hypothetical protein